MKHHRPLNFRRVFVLSAIFAMLMTYVISAAIILIDPVKRTAADFIAFYAAGTIARQQGISHIYQVEFQRQAEQKQIQFELGEKQYLLYNHPPYLIPILMFLISDNYSISFFLWMFFLTGIFLTSITILNNILPGQTQNDRWVMIFGGLLFLPIFASIVNGQDTAFLLLGTSIFIWGMFNQREISAGLGLSLLTLRPQMAIFFVIPLFFWSRKALRGYLIGSIGLVLFSLILIGRQGSLEFINLIQISASGEWFGMSESGMVNLLGLVHRLFPGLEAELPRQIAWGVYLLAGLGFSLFCARSKMVDEKKFGIGVVLFSLTSPHLHYHDLSLLLIPSFILLRELSLRNVFSLKIISLIPLSLSLMFFLLNTAPFLYYIVPYLFMGLLLALFSIPEPFPIATTGL